MSEPGPRQIDVTIPNAARLYDYYLGGTHNYTVDKVFATHVLDICPFIPDIARDNRAFLRRAIRFCLAQGIRQFLDIGSGIPTVGNVHEIAQEQTPDVHVVYVDKDSEVTTAAEEMLGGQRTVTAIQADLRQPRTILEHPDTARLIDVSTPVALLIVSTLPFVSDADGAHELMATYRDAFPSGSYLALSHITVDDVTPEAREQWRATAAAYNDTADPATLRTRAEFAAFFGDLQMVQPGIVYAPDWRPDDPIDEASLARPCNYAGVGYKP